VFYSLSSETQSGVRESSEFAYRKSVLSPSFPVLMLSLVDPIVTKPNLIVFSNALVTKLDIASAGNNKVTSSGVQVRFPDGTVEVAKTKPSGGEVILSAGVVRTPQLLELSGIGDPNVLIPKGITVKVNLPGVGANYEDQ
jgi:choline dehydrogenase-like flavoprotein